jgi:hypothetical protein
MKSKILLLAFTIALFTSCTTAYKTGQTPDDVYYSPARPDADEYVKTEKKQDRTYRYDEEYYEDQYLRMKVRDRYRWSELDDPYYYRSRYNYVSYNCACFSNPWSPSTYWNSYYNPYYQSHVYINPKSATYTGPRVFNLNTYNNNALTNNNYINPKFNNGNSNSGSNNTYSSPRNSTRSNENAGNILRDIFGSSNSNSSNSSSSSPKSSGSSGSSSSSSSSSSSNSSSAPVRKF